MSFVMIDKPFIRVVTWDLQSFHKLRAGMEEAVATRSAKFTVDLGRRYRRVEFETKFAIGLCEQLAIDFAKNPMPDFGENKEGKEP